MKHPLFSLFLSVLLTWLGRGPLLVALSTSTVMALRKLLEPISLYCPSNVKKEEGNFFNVFFFFVEKIKCGRFETKTINQSDSAIRKRRLVHWKYRPVVRHLRHVKRQTTAGGETKLKHKSRVEVYDRNIPSGS